MVPHFQVLHFHVIDLFWSSIFRSCIFSQPIIYTVPILKDKNAVYCKSIAVDDFRGISISPAIPKVIEHCILDRYRDFFKTSDNQFGFKQGSSCAHAIYSLSCVVDHYVNCGSTINMRP